MLLSTMPPSPRQAVELTRPAETQRARSSMIEDRAGWAAGAAGAAGSQLQPEVEPQPSQT